MNTKELIEDAKAADLSEFDAWWKSIVESNPTLLDQVQFKANEWADTATSALIWLQNIRDGISDVNVAIENTESLVRNCQRISKRISEDNSAELQRQRERQAVPDRLAEHIRTCMAGSHELISRAFNDPPDTSLQVALGEKLQWWMQTTQLLPTAPSPEQRQAVPKLHAASYEHNGKQYAITLEGCHEEVHAHAMRLGLTIDGVIVEQIPADGYNQRERQAVASGWKLVRIHPTVEQCTAGTDAIKNWIIKYDELPTAGTVWSAMLAAAPPADTVKQEAKPYKDDFQSWKPIYKDTP